MTDGNSFPKGGPRRFWLTPLMVLVGGLGFGACSEGNIDVPSFGGDSNDFPDVMPDSSDSTATAFPITPADMAGGTVFTQTIYPKFDDDYWRVPISAANQLVTVRVEYKKTATSLQLAVDWIGPRKLCVPASPTPCSESTPCTAGQMTFCDVERGGCRASTALPCGDVGHCSGGESCTIGAEDTLGTVIEQVGTAQHLILTNLPAHLPGDYFLRIYDRNNQQSDPYTEYELTVGSKPDPDLLDPNNTSNMASPISDGTMVEGFFSYHDDVDWYRIDPTADAGITTPVVVAVDLRWASGAQAVPSWTIEQEDDSFISTRLPHIEGTDNVHGATFVLPTPQPVYVRVDNSNGLMDDTSGYRLTVSLSEDPDEGNSRNDTPGTATVMDASSYGTVHGAANHTLIAENDLDWYRFDRSSGISQNSLMYVLATANTPDFMLQVLVFEQREGASCDPNTQATCATGDLCVCPVSGSCGASQGACIRPWVQRPVPNHPSESCDPQKGGCTPNQIETQLPVYDAGPGAYFVQVAHLAQVYPPRAGFSASDPYNLRIEHRQEPDGGDLHGDKDEFFPEPFGVSESELESHKQTPVNAGSIGSSVSGYISYDGDQDWFSFTGAGSGEGEAELILSGNWSGLQFRFQVQGSSGAVGYNGSSNGTVLDPNAHCFHMYNVGSPVLVWVNDDNFDDFDSNNAYTITLNIRSGCSAPPCHVCRCDDTLPECQP